MAIRALYSGRCPACGKRWRRGDEIATDDESRWVHTRCSNLPRWERPASGDFERKALGKEARHATCPDCGYGAGRHAALCRQVG